MKDNAIYTTWDREDGTTVHSVDHDGGGFVVSSEKVGVAIQNFLNNATTTDISVLHSHLLTAYHKTWDNEVQKLSEREKLENAAMHKRGFDDGENAAAWLVDGNTEQPFEFLTKLIKGLEDGDPAIIDQLPEPRVGGEFADDPTWEQICIEEVERYEDSEEELFAVYNEAFHEGVEAQIRKMHADYSPSRKV